MANMVLCVIPGQGNSKILNLVKSGSFVSPIFLYIPNDEKTSTGHLVWPQPYLTAFSWNQLSRNDALNIKSIFRIRKCDFLLYFTCFGFIISAGIWYNVMICILKLKSWPKQWCPGMTDWVKNQCSGFENLICCCFLLVLALWRAQE